MITGATGLLGRALMDSFCKIDGIETIGLGFQRSSPGIARLDLRDRDEVFAFIEKHKPRIIIHAAALRRPDQIESDPKNALALNVSGTKHLVDAAKLHGAWLLYISSDYVFDGTNPPYFTDSVPNPLNEYGKTKLAGEELVLKAGFTSLRVPLLYGPVEDWGECSITEMIPVLLAGRGESVWFDNWAIRYPTHVEDVAHVCARLAVEYLENGDTAGIYHFSGPEAFTKLEMATVMAQKLNITDVTLLPAAKTSVANRPFDAHLDTSSVKHLNLPPPTRFVQGISKVLAAKT
jgi:dTDP-4-dehydrorhamnose reductase